MPEDGSEGVMSNVQVCVQLVLSYPIPLDRDVFVILDTEDVTTGLFTVTCINIQWCNLLVL